MNLTRRVQLIEFGSMAECNGGCGKSAVEEGKTGNDGGKEKRMRVDDVQVGKNSVGDEAAAEELSDASRRHQTDE